MQTDRFQHYQPGYIGCPTTHFPVTPSNTVDLPERVQALYCNTAGTVALRDANGVAITYNVNAGQHILFRAVRVLATGTTATVIGLV